MADLHVRGFDAGWPASGMLEHVSRDIVVGCGMPLIGFAIIRVAADQAELLTITIALDARGKGHGEQLLRFAETRAASAGVDIVFLEVAEDNFPAIALYRRTGYEPMGRRPAYYKRLGGRVAALTFRKNLGR